MQYFHILTRGKYCNKNTPNPNNSSLSSLPVVIKSLYRFPQPSFTVYTSQYSQRQFPLQQRHATLYPITQRAAPTPAPKEQLTEHSPSPQQQGQQPQHAHCTPPPLPPLYQHPVPRRGGGHFLFEGRHPKQNYRPPVLCYHIPLSLSLLVYSPLFSRYQRTAHCYYICYHCTRLVDIIFSCPDTITIITVAKTLIIANPGCFPWTSQANNYSPNRKCPSGSPLLRVLGSVTARSFLAYSYSSVLQWVPKTRVSAPPPPGPCTACPGPSQKQGVTSAIQYGRETIRLSETK